MATPYFQQQSAAYNLYQKQNLHVFTPDGEQYVVSAAGKAYADYLIEVQDHLMHFEVEALLAQRDSLHDALVRRYVLQNFGAAGDPRFAGADLESVAAELKRRGIAATPLKIAMREATSRVNSEIKEIWPIRESGRSLQYSSYDIVFSDEEAGKAPQRHKLWDALAAWARESRLPGKEGARLATVQEWDDLGDAWAIRVDIHHYPRPDLESCRPITLLDNAERNKDIEHLRKALAIYDVELAELTVKPYAVPQTAPLREAEPPPPRPAVLPVAETLNAVREERARLEQQIRVLSDALTDSEERLRLSQQIDALEQEKTSVEGLLRDMVHTLDKLSWNQRPADWERRLPGEKVRLVAKAFEQSQASLGETQIHLAATRDKLNAAAVKLHQTEDDLAATHQSLNESQQAHAQTREKLDRSDKSLSIAQSELRLVTARAQDAEQERDKLAADLLETRKSRDQWQQRAEGMESNLRAELLKEHNAAMLNQELEFTRQIQEMQQNFMSQTQEMQQDHMRQIQDLQDGHLKQIQKLRRLAPTQELHVTEEDWNVAPVVARPQPAAPRRPAVATPTPPVAVQETKLEAAVSELGLYQAESQEIFDTRIGEYLRIAKDLGLSEADKWLLTEARKLAEARARQGELEI
ncbi:MAG: hypothetical protein KGZ83_20355 [Sulfuricella sp.]|nr:hypothetical protein [Sulfuricella sp.]